MTKKELFDIRIDKPSKEVHESTKRCFDALAKPIDGFGRFEDMICRIASVQDTTEPDISKKALVIMCADNGVVAEGVSQCGSDVTLSVARLMAKNESTVGIMTKGYPLDIIPVDIGIDSDEKIEGLVDAKIRKGTGDIAKESAMTESECLAAISEGIRIAKLCSDKGIKLIATGEMGIGNTTTSTALFCAITGKDPKEYTGRGAGIGNEGLSRKIGVIERALMLHGFAGRDHCKDKDDVLSALSKLGGLDISGLAGLYIGAAEYHISIVIDGAISAVAALTAERLIKGCRDYMLASHTGREKITWAALSAMDLVGVIDADMALGEGTGAVMLFPLLDMVMAVCSSGTTFDSASIESYERFDI